MNLITHLDADAFFASVEQASDARLRGRPIAVGGEKRGIIASASYEARQFGVYTPMPTVRARRLCPRLIVLPGDFEKYERFSRWMFSYAYDFTPDVEIASIDEGYFDLSAVPRDPVEVARTIRNAIHGALKITVSEGIGSNKLVSQVASKLYKPAAFHAVPAGGEVAFLHPLPNQWLPGVGPKTSGQLNAAGLARIGQVAATPVEMLELIVGSAAPGLRRFANGIDARPVVPASAPAKSYGQQETFDQDQTDEAFIEATLRRMADALFAKVRAEGKAVRTLTVKVRYNDMAEDQCGESLAEPTDLETDVYGRLHVLLRNAWKRRVSLRLVSLKLSNLYEGLFRMELALDRDAVQGEARRRLARVVDELRQERGRYVILRGHDLVLREKAEGRRQKAEGRGRQSEVSSQGAGVRGSELGAWAWGHRGGESPPSPKLQVASPKLRPAISELRSSICDPRFPPLVVRSHYTFLDSTLSPGAIVALAKARGMSAAVLCDVGNLHGAVEFVQAAREAGIRPVLGAEVRVEGKPVRLFVENATGYRNLCRWLTEAGRRQKAEGGGQKSEGTWGEALALRTPHSALRNGTGGLVAVAADPGLAPYFPGRFYLGVDSAEALHRVPAADRERCVAVYPVHYATPEDRWKFDVVQSIRTLTLLREAHPEKQSGGALHYPGREELWERFRETPEWLERAGEIVERCAGFELPLGAPQFPAFQPPDGSSPRAFLRRLVFAGAAGRYAAEVRPAIHTQLETELQIIHEVGYEEYFLVVWDILQACRRRGIDWITRGSAADSLVCYCLGISGVCPIRFDLYFRRFLNKERMALHKLPDIDVDFPHDRKDDVIDLIFEKYGAAHCAVVGGFSTFQARSAFAEVAKVLGVAEREVRRFTEHFPWGFAGTDAGTEVPAKAEGGRQQTADSRQRTEGGGSSELGARGSGLGTGGGGAIGNPQSAIRNPQSGLVALLRASPECAELPLDEEPYRSALVMAEFLDGVPRYPKMHPCGVVLSCQPMVELTPTFVSGKGYPTTHFDMDAVEAIGLVKIDILAQGGLAVMRDVWEMIEGEAEGRRQKVEGRGDGRWESGAGSWELGAGEGVALRTPHSALRTPYGDPEVWEMIATGNARAVHHIESPAMTSLCRMTNVREIDGLIAIVSVIRPGAANEQKKARFARRYQGLEAVEYPHPSLERCLRSTYGLVVYEEHILQICEAFAGLNPGRADVLRRALVKQQWPKAAEIGREFVAAARARGHDDAKIREVWGLVTGFNGYAFCKAHSTAYGVEAYQSAWLKRYYPAEFMAAVLTNGKGFYHPLVYVLECHRLGISLRPPWVNAPGPGYTVVRAEGGRQTAAEGEGPRAEDGGRKTAGSGGNGAWGWELCLRRGFGGQVGAGAGAAAIGNPHSALRTPQSGIRVPVTRVKGLTERTAERILSERGRGEFESVRDFYLRVKPSAEEMEALIRVGALDGFGERRTEQFWAYRRLYAAYGHGADPDQGWLFLGEGRRPKAEGRSSQRAEGTGQGEIGGATICNPQSAIRNPLSEPSRRQRLLWEMELLGFTASGHPLEVHAAVAWETYCPVVRLAEHVGEEVVVCGLVIQDRVHHQATGEPMKFLTLCDWTGMVETELFAATYRSYGLATVRYPVLEVTARVEPFENGRGHTLRVLRAGRPRLRAGAEAVDRAI